VITPETVLEYLKVPDTGGYALISSMIEDGYDYLRDAVDDFDDIYKTNDRFSRKADAWVLRHWMPEAYDQREGGYDGRIVMNHAARSQLTQLQLYRKEG
jgi:hypothetical protein